MTVNPYLISSGPDNSGSWLSCDLHVQTQFVARHHNDGVLGDHVSSRVQVDLGRIWLMFNIKEPHCMQKAGLQDFKRVKKVLIFPELWTFNATHLV